MLVGPGTRRITTSVDAPHLWTYASYNVAHPPIVSPRNAKRSDIGRNSFIANDANAAYWNPAVLSQITRGEVTLMRWLMSEVSQINVDHAFVAMNEETIETRTNSESAFASERDRHGKPICKGRHKKARQVA